MFHRFLRYLAFSSLLFGMTISSLTALPCADTKPTIAGAQIVVNSQNFVLYSTPNIPGHSYSWTVAGGTIAAGANSSQISVNWGAVGAGWVKVKETNPSIPCSDSAMLTVRIQPLLISYFYFTDSSCYGNGVKFWDNSVADLAKPIVNYYLDFGDGTPVYNSAVKPFPILHTYAGPPWNITYPVTYIVTNNEGVNDTIYDAVYVNPNQYIPIAAFSQTIPNCSYSPVSFDGTGSTTPPTPPVTGLIEYTWYFGDPASGLANTDSCATCSTPTHVFSSPGTYNVELKITNAPYCTNSIKQQVVIPQSVPSAKFTFSSPTCENNPVSFTDNSTFPSGKDIVTWEWYFGDGTPPVTVNTPVSPNVSHVFPGLGPYTVRLVVTNNLTCKDTSYHVVTLTPSPVADFNYGIPCAGDTMKFQNHSKQNNGPAIVSYYWNYGDPASGNNNSNNINGTHVYADSGTYIVTLGIANTTGCPDTIRKSIHINAKPDVEFTWNVGSLNNQIQFHIDSLPGGITNLGMIGSMCHWNFGDGTYGVGHNPIHTYLGSNNWTATLTVTDTVGCSQSVSHVIYVPEIPMAFYSSNSPVCLNTPMCFNDLSSVPSPPFGYIATWVWNFGDGTAQDTVHFPNNPNVCHTYANPGTYTVTETVTDNSGFTDSYSHDQIVLPLPIANFYFNTTCAGSLVQFTDASFPNGGGNIISWEWNFGDPTSGLSNTSLLQNPSHIFSTGGLPSYNVRLIIHNFDNCVDTIIKPVYVNPLPTVDFTRDTACLTELVHFYTDTVITHKDSIVSWLWNFGDGVGTSTDPVNTSYMYTTAGTYIASLTVTDHHGCVNTISHQVKVNPLPIPEFSWSTPACAGSVMQFTDMSTVPSGYTGYIAKWKWDFGDGTPVQTIVIPSPPSVTHSYPSIPPGATSYVVTLTVWTSDSCFLTKQHTVNLLPAPIANYSYSTVTCLGQSVQFTDLSQANGGGSVTQWHWNFGDPGSGLSNSATIPNPSHTFATAGSYTVTLIISNSTGCSDTVVKAITVNALPLAKFTDDTVCLHNPTTFTDLSTTTGNLISWNWDFGDGFTSPMQSPQHTYANYGIYTVTLTITNSNGCIKDTSRQILVNPLPVPEFSFSAPNCFGAVVNYTDHSTTVSGYLGHIVKWVWDFNDGVITTIYSPGNPNVSHTFLGSVLTHLVTLTITTSDSCTASISHLVTSIPSPIANFSFSTSTCLGQSVQFTDLSQMNGGGSIVSWAWNFGDPLSGTSNIASGPNPVHSFTSAGTFNVTLIVSNTSGCQDTILKTVTVNALPVANFTADSACLGSVTQFTDLSTITGSLINWNWDFGDGTPPINLQNPPHIYTNYGIYNVHLTVTNSNGCTKDTIKQVLVHPLPIPAFTYTTPNCLGAAVQYTNQSTTVTGYLGSIATWEWNFGDGFDTIIHAPGNPNISHIFLGTATGHNVRLTVTTTDSCKAFIEHVVNSMPSPIANFSFPTSNCSKQIVQFTDLSQANGGGNITTWFWDFGDPASGIPNTSTAQNPAHTFMGGPGVYNVTEIVSNASGCNDSIHRNVTIIALPVAKFIFDTVCLGTLTSFRDTSTATGTIVQRNWTFGDGGTSTLKDPVWMYSTSGVHIVTLTVTTAEGCIKDTSRSVLVYPQPVASFTTNAPTCSGDSVHFTDLSSTPHGTIHTWVWTFGDGGQRTITFPANPSVSHKYTAGGTYTVTLTITTSDGCTNTVSMPVVIQSAPTANFTYGTTRCTGQNVQFTDLSQPVGGNPITQWSWNFGDPTSGGSNLSNAQNPTHAFTHSGPFWVKLMVTNSVGCTAKDSMAVTINAGPTAKFIADTACVGSLTQFTDQSIPNAPSISSWVWDFGEPSSNNNSSTLQNPTHSYLTPGLFSVTLTVTNSNGCIHDTVKQISVSPKPQAMFQASVACVMDSTTFTDLSIAPGSGLSAWHWDFGDGSTPSTIENPKHRYTTAATFNVVLRVTNLSGCVDSIMIPVTTHPKPVSAFSYTSFFCPAGQVVFQDQSHGTGAAIVQREWIFQPGSTSSLINPTFIYSVTDTTYLVSLIVTDSYGCMDTISDSVHVKPGFKFDFRYDTVCFKDMSHFTALDLAKGDSLYNVSWNFGDPNSGPLNNSYTFNSHHTFSQPGIYVVKMRATDSDNCTDSVFHNVIVHALPAPAFSIVSVPCDSVIHFHDSTMAGDGTIASWIWNFGDGSPADTIPGTVGSGDTSHIYTVENTYPVVLKVTNSYGCSDTIHKTAELYPCIFASFTHLDTLMCARYKIAFSDSSLPISIINSWRWVFGDGLDTVYTHHSGVVYHTFANAGTYPVKLIIHATVPGSGRTFIDSTSQSLIVHATPMTYFSNLSVCRLQTTTFLDTSKTYGTAINSWKWTFGESYSGSRDTSFLKNPTHKYDSAGTFTVKLITMNRYGCKDSLVKPTRVFEIPTAVFDHSNACSGNPTYFTDKSLIADTANIVKWAWKFGELTAKNDSADIQDPIHQYKTDGTYITRLIVKDQHGCYDTVDSTITVHVTPVSSFTFTENINNMTGKLLFNNKSSGADTYYWDFGNGQTSTDENPVVTYANDGSFLVMLISNNKFNCSDTTYYKYEFIFKGLYIPNAFAPSSYGTGANVFAPVGINLKQFQIQVFDSWGHEVWSSTALDPEGRPTESWDGHDANNGVYPSGTYLWKAKATFIDNTEWVGADIGKGEFKTTGSVTLIR
jgi:PKD repeat protein